MIQVLAKVKITMEFAGASVVIFNNKTPDYSLNTTTWLFYSIPPLAPSFNNPVD
jgi:hypothetical protein